MLSTQTRSLDAGFNETQPLQNEWTTLPVMLPEAQESASRYRFHELLGAGGFGSVYRATDTHQGDEVAIKITRADKADNLAQQMNELDILQAIKPRCRENHVACVRDHYVQRLPFDATPGRLVIVMEYVRGSTLRALIESGISSPAELLSIATQLFEAIRFLHSMGIHHKDIKPDNLIWHHGHLTLVDFGVACQARQCRDKSGTPRYIWPRLNRDAQPTPDLYKASDRYAAAKTILELIEANGHQHPALSRVMTDVMRNPIRMTDGQVLSRLRALAVFPIAQ